MSANTTYFQNNLTLPIQFTLIRAIAIFLLVADLAGLFLSVGCVLWVQFNASIQQFNPFVCEIVLLGLIGLYIFDAYHSQVQVAIVWTRFRCIVCSIIVSALSVVFIYISNIWEAQWQLSQGILLASLGIFLPWTILTRFLTVIYMRTPLGNVAVNTLLKSNHWLVLGANHDANQFRTYLVHKYDLLNLTLPKQFNLAAPGSSALLESNARCLSGVVVGTEASLTEEERQTLINYRLQGVPIYQLSEAYEKIWYRIPSNLLDDSWFIFSKGFKLNYSRFWQKCKRLVDIISASLLLVVLSPLMLLAAIAIKLNSPGPLLYSQVRSGFNGQHFRVYKFRSMYQDAELRGAQWAMENDPRVTPVGRWLRSTRVDELPQLWNVLNGEMSLIGPRPERPEFDVKLAEVIPYYNVRYSIKPGITGWAQVMYPYGASVDDARQKLSYDLYYIKNYSFVLDLLIALKTIRVVLLRKGR
ncbi:MAG: exopolysaccharide biosynthesis polyprenyl glycosylphosphotransferase [Calothrix sp. C42_A2020_038]|nr:exopolysaccharide biosynthesis polyprenyl glycosylphosphotransferase [Calothrix sp. C42_A2020_038]